MTSIKQYLKTITDSKLLDYARFLSDVGNPDAYADETFAVLAELETRGLN